MILSVITINYNNKSGLSNTLKSVKEQTCKDFEYIVIDGGSEDGSKELIEANANIIDHWVSESDHGIYDAMNKGTNAASGDFVMFVNSGDMIASPDTISDILNTPLNTDINFFRVKNISADKGSFGIWIPPKEEILSFKYLESNPLHHPGAVIKREIQLRHPYRTEFRICADRCFFMESIIFDDCTYSTHDVIINAMEPQNTSGGNHTIEMENENKRIAKLLLPPKLNRDMKKIRWDILPTTQRLVEYRGVTSFICKLMNFLLDIIENTRKLTRNQK